MKKEAKKDFHFLPYMYNYRETTEAISAAMDAHEIDTIVKHFIESVSVLYTRKQIVSELCLHIEDELKKNDDGAKSKMQQALELIQGHIQNGYEGS